MTAFPARVAPLAPFLLLAACGGKDGGGGGDDSGGGDDTGLEQPDIDWTGACPAASGIGTATRWEYTYNEAYEASSGLSGGFTVEVTEINDDGTFVMVTTEESSGSNNTYSSVTTETWGCDDEGLWLLETYYEYEVTVYKPYEGYRDYTWNAPTLVMPKDVDVGSEWESVYDGTYVNELGASRSADDTVLTEVTGLEEVTVPAGTYTAMVWVQDASLTSPTTSWYVLGTGLVKSPEADLTAFTP